MIDDDAFATYLHHKTPDPQKPVLVGCKMDPLATRDVQSSLWSGKTLIGRSVCFHAISFRISLTSKFLSCTKSTQRVCIPYTLSSGIVTTTYKKFIKMANGDHNMHRVRIFALEHTLLVPNQNTSFTRMKSNLEPRKQSSGTSADRLSLQNPCLNVSSTSSTHALDGSAR